MICSNCGHDNQPTAAFCGRCGTELPAEQPRTAVLAAPDAVPSIAISRCSAAVGLLLLGLMVGVLVSLVRIFGYDPLGLGTRWVALGGGMALGLWLSASVPALGSGRLPGVVGLLLAGAASFAVAAGGLVYYLSSLGSGVWFAAFGAGIGLLLPRAFWLRLRHLSPLSKTALGIAVAIGLAPGLLAGNSGSFLAVPIVLIGLLVVARHPVVLVATSPARAGG